MSHSRLPVVDSRSDAAPLDHSPAPIPHSPLFVLVAGETSGDLLGAGLIKALRARVPAARFVGVGGPRMVAAGLEAWHPAEKLAVMGLVEVLRHLPELLRIRRDVRERTLALRPQAFIGIDAPDFNLPLERRLRQAGIRTIHYVSPSIWAWREQRAAKIGASADRVLCLFPMEPVVYARHGVDARFVGHPLADAFALQPDQAAARRALELPQDKPVLALLPGSRLGEIRRLGSDFIEASHLLAQRIPQLEIVAPMANADCRAAFESVLARSAAHAGRMHVIDCRAHEAMVAADAVLVASGTAALEAMLAKRPMVVAYRLAWLTHRIITALGLLKVERYSLPNHLAGRELVRELMQENCTPPALADALEPFLRARRVDPALLAEYERLHRLLGGNADHNAAEAVLA
ncbi:lipid-A-disaccharide synthase [Dokdonella sp.]|uniref:lipid-A-disaccharide synthase n=1 Tax=Dokdonella sp. TaxID=2291710 RepID=UPI0025C37F91|nr:lipid-A-disaccharide synthase [Dokdonella sp.]MBX3692909.1 lipid-A-disaccharide synthase [Dokdonella sp.]